MRDEELARKADPAAVNALEEEVGNLSVFDGTSRTRMAWNLLDLLCALFTAIEICIPA